MERIRSEIVRWHGQPSRITDSETVRHGRVTCHVETLKRHAMELGWAHGHWVHVLHHVALCH
jgi:hypothetical protein